VLAWLLCQEQSANDVYGPADAELIDNRIRSIPILSINSSHEPISAH